MCGLVGLQGERAGVVSRELLCEMAGELAHRGPDGAGLYLDRRFGMASTRLSIIDVAGGDQPLPNETGRYWVMQNGEIFNHPELRRELEARGHRFTTRSDTEVLVHAYEEWGAECLDRLNGEFAFAVWDRTTEELFLARDRFGIRPLFLYDGGGWLAFASEAKAILRHPLVSRELDPAGVLESFVLWAATPSRSAFAGIRELPPGHYLRVQRGCPVEERRWWDLRFASSDEQRTESEAELTRELLALLDDATRIRLRADVAVGSYLSGGVDSSAITALAGRHVSRPVRAFAIGFTDAHFDESPYQDRVARELGIEVTRVTIDGPEIAALMPRVVALTEKPTLRTAPAPLLRLSELVRSAGYKVVLTGEGADEMFAGYDVFKLDKVRRFWARQPQSRSRPLLLGRLYPYVAQDLGRARYLLPNVFGAGLADVGHPLYSHLLRFDHASRALRVFDPDALARAQAAGDPRDALASRLPSGYDRFTPLGKAQYLEIMTFMCGYLLHSQGDRMLMGNSVEGRFPFLDYRVAEFAARLPDRLKLPGLREKHILREAVRPLLPADVIRREKQPYRAPILAAFVGPAAPPYVEALLQPDRLREAGMFSPNAVAALIAKCRRNLTLAASESDEMTLVGMISVMLLHEQLIARPGLAPPITPRRVVIGSQLHSPDLDSTSPLPREIEGAASPA